MRAIIKKAAAVTALCAALVSGASTASAYDVVNLPSDMSMAEALEIYSASEIESATLMSVEDGKYINLTESEIEDFYANASRMTLIRRVNPNPMRGVTLTLHTKAGETRSFNLSSGVQLGKFGDRNYICYQPDKDNLANLMYLDSMYKEEPNKLDGAQVHLRMDYDFLKLPQDPWAVEPVKEACERSLLPYELSSNYNGYISRELFCLLLGNFIAVREGYAGIEEYMIYNDKPYDTGAFADCVGRTSAISIMHSLGVVNGKGGGMFDPEGCITRQEAAKMLTETANLFKHISTDYKLDYADRKLVAPWANYYVRWVSDMGIMSGVDKTHFEPTGYYTVQQAIATVTRLYNVCH